MSYSMNKLLLFLFSFIFFAGCSEKKTEVPPFQAFSLNVGSFSVGEGWEIDASVQVKDFQIQQSGDSYKYAFQYSVDLIAPDGKAVKSISTGKEAKEDKEKPADAQIEIQFNLDSKYAPGTYTVAVTITDELSKKQTTISKPVKIEL